MKQLVNDWRKYKKDIAKDFEEQMKQHGQRLVEWSKERKKLLSTSNYPISYLIAPPYPPKPQTASFEGFMDWLSVQEKKR